MKIPDNITIHEGIEFLPSSYICDVLLSNGVIVHLREDGSAVGDDGKMYYSVSRDDENGDCELLGYSCDIDAPVDDTNPDREPARNYPGMWVLD